MDLMTILLRIKPYQYYLKGKKLVNSSTYKITEQKNISEFSKPTKRSDIINFIFSHFKESTSYLEIGVRNPADNFDLILVDKKISVDPGVEFLENPVNYKMTSDEFFLRMHDGVLPDSNEKFDVIFIDGLHLAEQVDRDIENAWKFLKPSGFIVLHDCNPPTEWHARESFEFSETPAGGLWNGTTWKAFMKWRFDPNVYSCCIDTDWGVGILSKKINIGLAIKPTNPFFEFHELENNRKEYLNLITFDEFKILLGNY